ncbi:MAG: hypothetical protein IPL01_22740 [Acidobacteria bacterium]|nr:hypothetical protein [Acidobacteriota bacterium]
MKVLVISLYYEPDLCQSNGPIIRSICDDLARRVIEVTVLTSFPHYNRDSVWPEFRGRLFQADNVGRVRVIRSYIFVPRRQAFSAGFSITCLSIFPPRWRGFSQALTIASSPCRRR